MIKNFATTASASTPIACGGLITHIAASMPILGYTDTRDVEAAARITIPFLVNARDIQVTERQGDEPVAFRWIIHPQATYDGLGEVALPQEAFNRSFRRRVHYCIPGILPDSIARADRRDQGLPSQESEGEEEEENDSDDEEGESEEGEGGDDNLDGDEDNMGSRGPIGDVGSNMEMWGAGPSQSRAPSPPMPQEYSHIPSYQSSQRTSPIPSYHTPQRTSPHPSYHSQRNPPIPSPQSPQATIPLDYSYHGPPSSSQDTVPISSYHSPQEIPQPMPSPSRHYSPPHYPTQPVYHHPEQQYAPAPPLDPALDRAYFDRRFDTLLAGQQTLMESMRKMSSSFEEQFKQLNIRVDELYKDHTGLLDHTFHTRGRVNEMWEYVFPDRTAEYSPMGTPQAYPVPGWGDGSSYPGWDNVQEGNGQGWRGGPGWPTWDGASGSHHDYAGASGAAGNDVQDDDDHDGGDDPNDSPHPNWGW